MSYYIHIKWWVVVSHPCHLTPLNLANGQEITSYRKSGCYPLPMR